MTGYFFQLSITFFHEGMIQPCPTGLFTAFRSHSSRKAKYCTSFSCGQLISSSFFGIGTHGMPKSG